MVKTQTLIIGGALAAVGLFLFMKRRGVMRLPATDARGYTTKSVVDQQGYGAFPSVVQMLGLTNYSTGALPAAGDLSNQWAAMNRMNGTTDIGGVLN